MEEALKANTDSGETLRQKETNTDILISVTQTKMWQNVERRTQGRTQVC